MRKLKLFIVVLFKSAVIYSQPIIVKNDATQVLFIGKDNPITVSAKNFKPSSISVKVSTGSIEKIKGEGKYNWRICATNDSLAYVKIFAGSIYIDSISLRILKIEEPYISLFPRVHCRSGFSIRPRKGVIASFNDEYLYKNTSCKVLGFDVSLTIEGQVYQFKNEGAAFDEKILKLLARSKDGDLLIIDNIKTQVGCETSPRKSTESLILYSQ